MQNNRIHDLYRAGEEKPKKEFNRSYIELELEITNFSKRFIFPIEERVVLSSEQISEIDPQFGEVYGWDGKRNLSVTTKDCIGYQFFDRQEYIAADGERLLGSKKNVSPNYYFAIPFNKGNIKIYWEEQLARRLTNPNISAEAIEELKKDFSNQFINNLYWLKHCKHNKTIPVINRFGRAQAISSDSVLLPFKAPKNSILLPLKIGGKEIATK